MIIMYCLTMRQEINWKKNQFKMKDLFRRIFMNSDKKKKEQEKLESTMQ
jgi:hypothetical protein